MRIVLIVPYFGKFPNYFQLVLNSCRYNEDMIDWYFYTDDHTNYDYPSNCYVNYCTFEEMRERIQKKFDFNIALDLPYKLCDYKPAYGYIFEENIKKYDYWGHCDIDCIFGKISNFIKEDAFECDRILRLGHLCLYRNTEDINRRFMLPIDNIYRYKEVFTNTEGCIFDEHNASGNLCIDDIWEKYNFTQFYGDKFLANVYYKSNKFILKYQINKSNYEIEPFKKAIFYWVNGRIIRKYIENDELIEQEFAYIHLMKRKMKNKIRKEYLGPFKIIPNSFEEVSKIPENIRQLKHEKKSHINNQYFRTRYNNLKVKVKRIINK